MRQGLLLCLLISACSTPGEKFVLEEEFVPRIREIAAEYSEWARLGDVPSWAPTMCLSPPSPGPLLSESRDTESHGRKLYFLYARDVDAYRATLENDQPVGQAFVKQSFDPIRMDSGGRDFESLEWAGHATRRDDQHWRIGSPRDLFVMYKLDPSTPNTDAGWVYGTITPEGEVTSAGRVANCVECHADAKRDRMFGAKANDVVAESGWEAYEHLHGDDTEGR